MTWDTLAAMSPEDIKSEKLWPASLYPLPYPHLHNLNGSLPRSAAILPLRRRAGRPHSQGLPKHSCGYVLESPHHDRRGNRLRQMILRPGAG